MELRDIVLVAIPWVLLGIVLIAVQWWLTVVAIRKAMRDHTIWQYTTWPDVKKGIDEGRLDAHGKPTT